MWNLFASRRALTIAGSLLAIVSIAAIAQAATDTIYRYSTPRTGVFQLSALAMTPTDKNVDYEIEAPGGRVRMLSGSGCFTGGVNLPNGATITSVAGIIASGGGAGHPGFVFMRHTTSDGDLVAIAMLEEIFDDSGARKIFKAAVSEDAKAVNNNLYSYGFVVCLPGTADYFYGAKIGYTFTHAGD
jgi:hypothetical protein